VKEFETLGARVVGISKDSVKSHQNFVAKQGLGVTLLSDPDLAWGVAFGVAGERVKCGKNCFSVDRSTFLIDPKGVVRAAWPKVKVDGHAEAVLKTLRELVG
jgi:thioredoxin-dependent peroxiredoxin